jgi:hypothetical protein
MIRLLARGICAVLLDVASFAVFLALVCIGLSAYLTSRVVGVSYGRRTEMAIKIVNQVMASGLTAKRNSDGES